jgi:predicted secreted hydrolase
MKILVLLLFAAPPQYRQALPGYPIRWRITVPSPHLRLECAAAMNNQELVADDASSPSYWEGAVTYSGTSRGSGYLEMTGYNKPMRL